MKRQFWAGKRVFLTGHTGFKGSWLCFWLNRLGARVTGHALEPPTRPSLFELARIGEGMTSLYGDVCGGEELGEALRAAQPEIVVHMAAQGTVYLVCLVSPVLGQEKRHEDRESLAE